ncbi:1-acyl-sn-glycerol-3-phosphate acyltransferase [Roseovarius faecimaris]|uniref:1-acyl-sn-glycerol-3-phosphate acyltransferase n=1 Tax=Roseovarius faecimaris TaxID=2494550 RepID=A0A6I6IM75_9RHOB|nr:lysophospholipid acyltransferase family protein [Roseovarius faecimaris]QGX96883.1 1-acyl-sn-glycerol-3-phosphate acyltransferase [Roseovarius faecimaris]
MPIVARVTALAIIGFSRLITAVQGFWPGGAPDRRQAIYFANHTSNGDFILIWTVLGALRWRTRPVAAADYWLTSPVRRFIGTHVINAVLIDRNPETRTQDPIEQMVEALDEGSSLIIFPEGTRNSGDDLLLPFKPGIFHLAEQRPDIPLIPAWIENLNRVLPKGEVIPVPYICTVKFGAAMSLEKGESKDAFLRRAETMVLALHSEEGRA